MSIPAASYGSGSGTLETSSVLGVDIIVSVKSFLKTSKLIFCEISIFINLNFSESFGTMVTYVAH